MFDRERAWAKIEQAMARVKDRALILMKVPRNKKKRLRRYLKRIATTKRAMIW
jgi:hypothetical protein